MSQCWKCSVELTDKDRCGSCDALNTLGSVRIHGVIRDDDEVTIYVSEDDPGHLFIDLRAKRGQLSQLPQPNKKGALGSKPFKQLWAYAIGDHPLLQSASPQSFKILGPKSDKLLFVEVHGLTDQPAPRVSNGVVQRESEGEPDDAAGQEIAEAPQADAPEGAVEPMAAASAGGRAAEALPGLELAALPVGNIVDAEARLKALKDEIGLLIQGEQVEAAHARLRALCGQPDSGRKLAENLYLHLACGQLAARLGDSSGARTSLSRAFELDPRDASVLLSYGQLLDRATEPALALKVDRNLLLHHRRSLDEKALSAVFRRVGQAHRAQGDVQRARASFEQALDARSDDQEALDLLLEILVDEGDAEQVLKIRQRLLDQMRDPKTRAILRIRMGDDYRSLGDNDQAIEQYEMALAEHPNSTALKRIARISAETGQWRAAADAYTRMVAHLRTDADRSQALLEAASIFHHHLGSWEQAARYYEQALEATPDQLDILTELVSLLAAGERWQELRGVYERMIERSSLRAEPPRALLAVLWRKLGELLRQHLHETADALSAFATASDLSPDDMGLHELLADLYQDSDDDGDRRRAIHHNRQLLNHALDADQDAGGATEGGALNADGALNAVERLGMAHLHLKELDQALCAFRVLSYAGQANDPIQSFVDSNSSQILKPLKGKLDAAFFKRCLLTESYDPMLGEVFSLVCDAFNKLLDHDPEHYALSNKDRVDRKDGLMFTKIFKDITHTLGIESPPAVYHKKGVEGMFNASLHPVGFIVGDDILSGCSEKEISFVIAKQLALSRPESFLFQTRTLKDMGVFFHIILKVLNPNHNITLNKDMERLAASVRKLKPEDLQRLGVVIAEMSQRGQINIGAHQQSYEDAANRCGLLFCDDLATCRSMLAREPHPVNPNRDVESRMQPLVRWTLTPAYQVLRQDLGISIA